MMLRSCLYRLAVLFALIVPVHNVLADELQIEVITAGEGSVAEDGLLVSVHYQGRLTNGTVFDESYKRGEPFSFILGSGQVIQGWEQGIKGMQIGEKRLLTIPPELGYGLRGAGQLIPPGATLIFTVELVAVEAPPRLAEASPDDLKTARENNIAIIDIRRAEEWQETGIIEGAHTITAFAKNGQLHPDFQRKFFALIPSRDTPFLLYCRTGNRTGALGEALVTQLGYKRASHLTQGIAGWIKDGQKTVPYQP